MLSSKNKLKKKNDFDRITKRGKAFSGNFFVMKVLKNNTKETRFGFVVSRKTLKKAVERNKIKRRLRSILKNKIPETKKGYDVVFFAKKGIEKTEFKKLKETVEEFLKKAELY
jgi:ribonuclease P protein component